MLRDLDPKLLGGEFRLKRTTAGRDRRPNVPRDQPG
jgi:hypothetical protein